MIVHGVLSLAVGGLERIVVALAKHENAAVVCVESPGELAGEVTAYCLHKPPGRDAAYIAKAESLLRELRPSVLHTHQIGAAWYLAPAAKRLGIRVVHTEHGNPFARSHSWREWFKLRLLMRQATKNIDAFAAVSSEIAEAVMRYRTVRNATVVPNGIEIVNPTMSREAIRDSLGIPQSAFVIGTVGRLNEVKQQDVLLRAASVVKHFTILLVGDGPELPKLEALAKSFGVRAVFAGYQSQPVNYLQAMDVFALTSRSEGFPVSLLEAWSCKLPVVVNAVGGLPAIVDHGVNGLLVKDPYPLTLDAAFTLQFCELIANPERCRALGEAGFATLQREYTFEKMVERYRRLYLK